MSLVDRFRAMPRAMRWLLWAGVGLVGYFAVVDPVLKQAADLRSLAADKADKLARIQSAAAALATAESDVKAGVQRFGLVSLPGDPKERSEAFLRRIDDILAAHHVRDHTRTGKETPLGTGPLTSALGADYRVDRLVVELQFDASPETVAAVLADLERAPEVAAVSRLQVRKAATQGARSSGKMLKTTIAVEAWQLVRKGRSQ